MAMHTVPKTIFDRSLKLARAPFDAALGVVGGSNSSAKHALDRFEAGLRGATGTLFRDEELTQQGRQASLPRASANVPHACETRPSCVSTRQPAASKKRPSSRTSAPRSYTPRLSGPPSSTAFR